MLKIIILTVIFLILSAANFIYCTHFRYYYIQANDRKNDDDAENPSSEDDVSLSDEKEKVKSDDKGTGENPDTNLSDKKEKGNTSDKDTLDKSRQYNRKKRKHKSYKISIASVKESISSSKRFSITAGFVFLFCAVFFSVLSVYGENSVISILQGMLLFEIVYVISSIDLKLKKIPNKLLLVLLSIRIVGIMAEIVLDPSAWLAIITVSIIGCFIGGMIILLGRLISRGGVGAGDMKLFAVIGLYFGVVGIIEIMMYSLLLAALVSIFLLVFRKAKFKSSIPMAPFIFLSLAAYLVFLYM